MKSSTLVLAVALTSTLAAAIPTRASVPDQALILRNLGNAQLENEQPVLAEEAFRELIEILPDERLGYANLSIALMRQQKFEEAISTVDQALSKAPGDADVLAIRGEILQWGGKPDEALIEFKKAAEAAPTTVAIQYALYRQATTYAGEGADTAADQAMDRLIRLRPENPVLLLQAGQRALQAGDRSRTSKIFLRIQETAWQAPAAALTLIDQILAALEADDLAAARVPALRLENVLKITAMYREGLRELAPGIQGIPLLRLQGEPLPQSMGEPAAVTFHGQGQSTGPIRGPALASGDFDDDQKSDWAFLTSADDTALEVWLAADSSQAAASLPAPGAERLLVADLDNDGHLDLIAFGAQGVHIFRGLPEGSFEPATEAFGLQQSGATAGTVLDFDIEGDLDLALFGGRSASGELFRNSLRGPLEAVGSKTLPAEGPKNVSDVKASDLDRDGDVDLILAHDGGLTWLDNLRQGQFVDRTADGGLAGAKPATIVISADLDNDGLTDLVAGGSELQFFHNLGGSFEPWDLGSKLDSKEGWSSLVVFDADNDGRMDLGLAGPSGVVIAAQRPGPAFEKLPVEGAPSSATSLAAIDLDQDCDLDLLVGGPDGLTRLENRGGSENRCMMVRLRGLDKGNSKNNILGFGATLEVIHGLAYQFQEVSSDVTHFGLGQQPTVEILRAVWTNGVPQNRLQPPTNQWIVEEQLLKGSCPFLYAWDGERVQFVTDLLWGAPAGLPVAPGVWASSDPQELVRVDGAVSVDGSYRLMVTEELWEAAFFDYVRAWVVDHPDDLEVASNLRIVPGRVLPETVLATRGLRPVARAWDAKGEDVTARVATRDGVFADGWERSAYQGVAAEPWQFAFDLGASPSSPIRLHLDGWIFPSDASLNLAVAQRPDLETWPPRLEVETETGWQVLMPSMGFPAGKSKTMVIDTPPLPEGATRLRIVGTQWLSWDRIAWSTATADDEPIVQAKLPPAEADLHYRGFSEMVRPAPNGPHLFDYELVSSESPWLDFPGHYTRYGDVRELLQDADDRSVIMGPGDEMILVFDVSGLAPVQPGWRRTLFLESHGWDKDADRNTGAGDQVEPLPFRAMSVYPYGTDETFPQTPLHREYLERWLTRVVPADS